MDQLARDLELLLAHLDGVPDEDLNDKEFQAKLRRIAAYIRPGKRARRIAPSQGPDTRARRACSSSPESFCRNLGPATRTRFLAVVNRVRDATWYETDQVRDNWRDLGAAVDECRSPSPLATICLVYQRSLKGTCYRHRMFQMIIASAFDAEAGAKVNYSRDVDEFCKRYGLNAKTIREARDAGKCYLEVMEHCGVGSIFLLPAEISLGNHLRVGICAPLATCLNGVEGFQHQAARLDATARTAMGDMIRILSYDMPSGCRLRGLLHRVTLDVSDAAPSLARPVRPAPGIVTELASESEPGHPVIGNSWAGDWGNLSADDLMMSLDDINRIWQDYFAGRGST